MSNSVNQGKTFENLVSILEKVLSGSEHVKITAPAKLKDRTNGSLREHDVLLTITQGHHTLYTAIECREHSRKITVNQIEGFSQKCSDTGISQGVIVSSKGFFKSAKAKADHLNIRCLLLSEVEKFDWLLESSIKSFTWKKGQTSVVLFQKDIHAAHPESFAILDKDGVEFSLKHVDQNIHHEINKLTHVTMKEGVHPLKFVMDLDGFNLKDNKSDVITALSHAVISTVVEVSSVAVPFRMVTYEGDIKVGKISESAIAKIDAGIMSGHLVLSHKNDQITVSFVPDTNRR